MCKRPNSLTSAPLIENQVKLAVHCHLFYVNMWPQIKSYLENLKNANHDLFITLVEENAKIISQIKQFNPNAQIYVVENKGYDVGPFIYVLRQIDLSKYDYILKIHSKAASGKQDIFMNGRVVERQDWCKLLYEALLKNPQIVKKNLRELQQNSQLGMIGSKYCIVSSNWNSRDVRTQVLRFLSEWGYPNTKKITFVSGTMFMVRASLMQKFKEQFSLDDFLPTDGKVGDGTLAHILERLFGAYTKACGYKIQGFDRNISFSIKGRLKYIWRFLYHKKHTSKGYLQIKICKLPVFHKKILEESK